MPHDATLRPTPTAPEGVEQPVRFLLDGEVHSVDGVDPNTTVLDYLRERLRRTGTKEGCAEGDCGACTVVVGELDGDRAELHAVNSCIQLLPTLDGKALYTVESLQGDNGRLHPAQSAMVDCHGSQCGFCTPGFVMSLFALYESRPEPSRLEINDVLAGNLCRCTGYRPIVDAARAMYRERGRQAPAVAEGLADRLRAIRREGTFTYSGPSPTGGRRRFFAPRTLSELAELRVRHPEAHLLAGGTDVGLWVTKEHKELETVLYTGNVHELRRLAVTESHVEIGAAVTVAAAHRLLAEHYPDLGEICRRFGSPPIRNAATIGGNVANGSPIGDSMPALIALGSTLVLRRGDKTRELPLDEFYLAYRRTALGSDELVEKIRVPLPHAEDRFAAYKISKRFDQDISSVCAAFRLRLDGGKVVRDATVCFGGMAAVPQRAAGCEAALRGRKWDQETVATACEALDRDYTPIDDMRASARYRASVARNLLRKFHFETSGATDETRLWALGPSGGGAR